MSDTFLKILDLKIQDKHLLKNIFYKAWTKGELTQECLKVYAKDYYHHVKAFPTYLSAIHARTEEAQTRRILLQNLIEEEAGNPNHPELWKQFVLSLGVTEEELDQHVPSKEICEVVDLFRDICSKGHIGKGIAALYAYESQIPEICVSKIDGLKKFYGLKNPRDWAYFSVHIEADKEHAAQERSLLGDYCQSEYQEQISLSVDRVLDSLNNFLSSLYLRFVSSSSCKECILT